VANAATAEVEALGPEITKAPVEASVIGLIAGIGSALLGIGGGLVMVPLMVFRLHIRQHRAVGTSLAVMLPTVLVAAIRYQMLSVQKHEAGFNPGVILWLAVGGVLGAQIGATIANLLNAKQLRSVFGWFVAATGVYMTAKAWLAPQVGAMVLTLDFAHGLAMVGVGVLVGLISGLMGVGGGLVMVPALALLMGYQQRYAQGVSLAVIIPVSISGALVHWRKGNIVWSLFLPMAIAAAILAWVTTGVVFHIPQDQLRMLFGVFMIWVGFSMVRTRQKAAAVTPPPVEPEER
jgi:uncharacterized membrane protein YfcA